MIPVPSKGITAEERLRLKRYNREIFQKCRVGFNMLDQSMGTNAVFQNVISFNSKFGDLRGSWNAIPWEKYDSKKPAMRSLLATEFSHCLYMPDETVEHFINRLNNICARLVNDPREAMKKTQVIKGICNEFAAFAQIKARQNISWSEYCTSIKD